jgi:hypothetical protein
MHDCILALGLDRGRALWGRLFASALLAGAGYPNLTKGINRAANLRVRDRSQWPGEARSQPVRQPSAKGELRLILYPQKPTEYACVFVFSVFVLGLF